MAHALLLVAVLMLVSCTPEPPGGTGGGSGSSGGGAGASGTTCRLGSVCYSCPSAAAAARCQTDGPGVAECALSPTSCP
jgi:hypothetical protein